jgi:hypothetical protein
LPHVAGQEAAHRSAAELQYSYILMKKQQFWRPCTNWQTYLTSQLQLTLWTEGPNTTHKPVIWWDHIRASACRTIPGLDTYGIILKLLPKDWTFCSSWTWCFSLWGFLSFFYFINFTIITFLSLFLSLLLSLVLLCYSPLFSLPNTISAFDYLLFLLSSPPPTCHHTSLPSHTRNTHWLAYCINCTKSQAPAIPDTSTLHYNRNHPNTHKGHKTQQPPYLFPYPPIPFPTPPFGATFTNFSNFYF